MSSGEISTKRVRAFKVATRHGYFVRAMKLLLPLTAAGVVFAMFVSLKYSMMLSGAGNISVGAVKVSTNNLKMINPKMDGFTNEGGKYSVTAAEAIQEIGNTDEIQLVRVKAHLIQPSKDWAKVTAPNGMFHVKREVLDLTGDINVTSSNGMKAFLTEANIFVKTQRILSNKPVRVEMLNGSVRAQTMRIDAKARIVLFKGRVRVKIKKRSDGAKPNIAVGKAEKR